MNIYLLIALVILVIIILLGIIAVVRKKLAYRLLPLQIVLTIVMAGCFVLQISDLNGGAVFGKTSENLNKETESLCSEYEVILDDILKESYGNSYTLDRSGTTYNINIWTDGLRKCVDLANQGDSDSIAGWEEITANLDSVCRSYYEMFSGQTVMSPNLMWTILDDTDRNIALYTSVNGITVYNAATNPQTD